MKSSTCSICKWTNVDLWNIGKPGKPKWICHGCAAALIGGLTKACRVAFRALDDLKTQGDAQDWEAFSPLHKSYRLLRNVVQKAGAK